MHIYKMSHINSDPDQLYEGRDVGNTLAHFFHNSARQRG